MKTTKIFLTLVTLQTISAMTVWADIAWSGEKDLIIDVYPSALFSDELRLTLELDLDGNGTVDYRVGNTYNIESLYVDPQNTNGTTGDWIGQSGAIINETLTYKEEPAEVGTWGDVGGNGAWIGENGYMALKFESINGTSYGWLHMSAYNDYYMIIHDWAYETTPDEGIVAGAIPEPSSGALLLIGSLGLWHLRRLKTRGRQPL